MIKAMVLAAGRGTRLRPITDSIPKCLVSAGGRPLLYHALTALQCAGVEFAVVNVCYLADQVEDYLTKNPLPGMKVVLSREDHLLDTGGSIRHARTYFEECDAIIVHNADVYSECRIAELIEAHLASGDIATLAVSKRRTTRFLLFEGGALVGWRNTDPPRELIIEHANPSADFAELAFNGISVFSPDLFQFMNYAEDKFSIVTSWLDAARQGRRVGMYRMDDSPWFDIGTAEKLAALNEFLQNRGE